MAGHSKFKNIMHRKGAQDKKRASLHGRLIREVSVAVRLGGADVSANPRLRLALSHARAANLNKDVLARAVERASGKGTETDMYQEVRYEGFGPLGVAIVIEAQTDNRNRTAAELRMIFNKNGGNLAEQGGVIHGFEHIGRIVFDDDTIDREKLLQVAVEEGAQDIDFQGEQCEVVVSLESFHHVHGALEKAFGPPQQAALVWRALTHVQVTGQAAESLSSLLDQLADNEDISAVFANYTVDEETAQEFGL